MKTKDPERSRPIGRRPASRILLAAALVCALVLTTGACCGKKASAQPYAEGAALLWADDADASLQGGDAEIALDAFPGVTFRWTGGSAEAIENGKTRTLFSGMPVRDVYLSDVTGDGRPDFCATVCFGSGMVDEHIVVYDYANLQSYTLWERGRFDWHLYTAEGALYAGKTPYGGDKQVESGTLGMSDGALSYRSLAGGAAVPLARQMHESELYGEWLVEEEKDNEDNVLYTFAPDNLWKEYNFREDGTVVYNETVPISSDSELAFGHPKDYPYEVHDGHVYIDGDTPGGFFRWGAFDRETGKLTLRYSTADGTVYATLRRMGE